MCVEHVDASELVDREHLRHDVAMMVVISVSRWAGGEGDQQQLKQLPLRRDASRDTTPYQNRVHGEAA